MAKRNWPILLLLNKSGTKSCSQPALLLPPPTSATKAAATNNYLLFTGLAIFRPTVPTQGPEIGLNNHIGTIIQGHDSSDDPKLQATKCKHDPCQTKPHYNTVLHNFGLATLPYSN